MPYLPIGITSHREASVGPRVLTVLGCRFAFFLALSNHGHGIESQSKTAQASEETGTFGPTGSTILEFAGTLFEMFCPFAHPVVPSPSRSACPCARGLPTEGVPTEVLPSGGQSLTGETRIFEFFLPRNDRFLVQVGIGPGTKCVGRDYSRLGPRGSVRQA